jgi:hypothetical protein
MWAPNVRRQALATTGDVARRTASSDTGDLAAWSLVTSVRATAPNPTTKSQ